MPCNLDELSLFPATAKADDPNATYLTTEDTESTEGEGKKLTLAKLAKDAKRGRIWKHS